MTTVIADLPVHERPRERLLRCGVEALSERELLALIVGHGRGGEGALDLAASLLADYRDLAELACARPEELLGRPGIGLAKAAAIVAAFRLGRLARASVPLVLQSAGDVARSVSPELAQLRRERIVVVVCDARNQVCRKVVVTDGALDRSHFPIREILNAVLRHDGRAFAIAHNHPSGDPSPSAADWQATAELSEAARITGVRFIDHVVVAGDSWCSVARSDRQRLR